jgi:FlaA1/EpsC-like NDP-sugar epimerase
MGKGGELFILDMGEPVRIVDLAHDMINLSGLVPEKDIKIVFTGLRPGEKLYEELLTDGEEIKATLHEKIKVAGRDEVDGLLRARLDEMFLDLQQNGFTLKTLSRIKEIVPEFQPEKGGPAASRNLLRNVSCEVARTPSEEQSDLLS